MSRQKKLTAALRNRQRSLAIEFPAIGTPKRLRGSIGSHWRKNGDSNGIHSPQAHVICRASLGGRSKRAKDPWRHQSGETVPFIAEILPRICPIASIRGAYIWHRVGAGCRRLGNSPASKAHGFADLEILRFILFV